MTNDIENVTADGGLNQRDVPILLAALVSGSGRVERVALSGGVVWIKRYGTERARLIGLKRAAAALFNAPFIRPSPAVENEGMARREVRRIQQFAAKDVPAPRVVYSSGSAVVLTDVGGTVREWLDALPEDDAVSYDGMLVRCTTAVGRLHAKGLAHGRPYTRDMFLKDGQIGFMDFEEEPEAVMPLAVAQARDIWLLFMQVATSARLGKETHDRAYRAWADVAPPEAVAELRKLTGVLGGFLWLARLIGRVHMGSDLRRFIVATSYLMHVSLNYRQD
ncbi:serine/threonine protein phosphatase [Rhizobium sp. Root1220]|uniref:serine/threonine protein phosphatase n=1 Tax=Rhizobium sp. Root1220 TaxID=1736432 RepID=UPI000A9A4D18|nr:serine/threonine protein phosphatase [Rhizobium sp. Root1220]